MYYFNIQQLMNIDSCVKTTKIGLSKQCFDGRAHYWPQRLCEMDRLLVTDVIKICNCYHIPFETFITTNPDMPIVWNDSIIQRDNWQDIQVSIDFLLDIYQGRGNIIIPKKRMCQVMGVTPATFYRWTHYEDAFAMKITQLVDLINECRIPLSCVINSHPQESSDIVAVPEGMYDIQQTSDLTARIAELEQLNKQLTEENTLLKQALAEMQKD